MWSGAPAWRPAEVVPHGLRHAAGGTAPSPRPADPGGHVVVQAIEIQGLGDQVHVLAGGAEGREKNVAARMTSGYLPSSTGSA